MQDKDHVEFLADISSFANAQGGDVVLGMEADKGVPISFSPLDRAKTEGEILRLEQMARSPRLQIENRVRLKGYGGR